MSLEERDVPARTDVTFTILINNYNYGRFLGKAIESALQQTWSQVQVLVVDDGSSDDSLEVAGRFTGPNYMVLTKPNGGQNSAIAHGLQHAGGDYTIILDSDDWLKPEACEKIAKAIGTQRPNGVHYRLERVDPEGRVIGHYPLVPFVSRDQRAHVLRRGTIPTAPTSGNAYRTDFLKEAFGHIQPGTWFSDGYLAMAAAATDDVAMVDAVLGYYLVHGMNVSQKSASNDAARRFKNNNYTLEHYRHLFSFLEARGSAPDSWLELIEAYAWRRILYFKLRDEAYNEFTFAQCRTFGTRKFICANYHGVAKQVKSILFLWVGSLAGELRDHLRGRA